MEKADQWVRDVYERYIKAEQNYFMAQQDYSISRSFEARDRVLSAHMAFKLALKEFKRARRYHVHKDSFRNGLISAITGSGLIALAIIFTIVFDETIISLSLMFYCLIIGWSISLTFALSAFYQDEVSGVGIPTVGLWGIIFNGIIACIWVPLLFVLLEII